MGRELFDSIVAKIAVHCPLLAKGLVQVGVEKIGATPATVSPIEMKRALDEHIVPMLGRVSPSFHASGPLGGGIIQTDIHDRLFSMSPSIYQYLTEKRSIADPLLFEDLRSLGLTRSLQEMTGDRPPHVTSRVEISRPQRSILEATHVLVQDDRGSPAGILSFLRDITLSEYLIEEISALYEELRASHVELQEKAQIEEQLQQAQKMEALGQLSSGISHDLNNLLYVISGFAELILKKFGDSSATLYEYGRIISENATRASGLTSKLLAFARKGKYVKAPVDLHGAVGDIIKISRHALDRRIEICEDLRANAPRILGDCSQLQNAVLNLIVNARDAMPEGGTLSLATETVNPGDPALRTFHDFQEAEEYVLLTVTDTGMGMSEEVRQRIFDPFFTTKEVGKGTGLGLAGVHGTVKRHGGAIDVTSQLGQGSSFRIVLPVMRQQ